jgi:hypothetical protein
VAGFQLAIGEKANSAVKKPEAVKTVQRAILISETKTPTSDFVLR